MSDFRVIREVTLRLRALLFDGLTGANGLAADFSAITSISLDSPAEILDNGNTENTVLLSLYLYQVVPNAYLKNYPLTQHGPGEQRFPPLQVDLHYLLTPLAGTAAEDHEILGRAMQILEASATLRGAYLDSDLRPGRPEARLTFNPVTLEELTRIWNAFNQPHHLSVCYRVQGVAIDSARQPQQGPAVREGIIDVHLVDAGVGL